MTPRSPPLDLQACAREPIHLLGRTQDFGVLLAIDAEQSVVKASGNAEAWCGVAPQHLLGLRADRLLPRRSVDAAFAHAVVAARTGNVQHLFGVGWPGRDDAVDVTIHASGALVVVEAEPAGPGPADAALQLEASARELACCDEVDALARSAARTVARLTGFDRVMVYRFAADGSGTVIAEALVHGLQPYLGLRYPASDIPAQARALYLRNPIRLIVDASSAGLTIASLDDEPLDLSMAALRSVSPVHLQYMRNMGSAASMSVSIVIDGKLWGLIACHHRRPRRPPLACRSMAELLGRLYALAIARIERKALESSMSALLLKAPGLDALVDPATGADQRSDICAALGRQFGASGIVMRLDGQQFTWGMTPAGEACDALAAGLAAGDPAQVHAIESLAAHDGALLRLSPGVAGVLALPMSAHWRDWLLVFRDEVRRHVVWAGEPAKAVDEAAGSLTPRASFAAWREQVRWHCEPWTTTERELAEALRVRLLEVLLAWREQRELDQIRRAAKQQSLLVRELNHRVRNMLGLIKGLVHQTARGASSIEELTARLEDRVHALSRAYTQIETTRWQPTSLAALVGDELHAFAEPSQIDLQGEPVNLEPDAYLSFAMVVHELATNARKYGALSVPDGRVRVSWRITPERSLELDWQESGGPPVQAPRHRGFGTRLIGQALTHQLRGHARLEFDATGLHAHLSTVRGFVPGSAPRSAASPATGARMRTGRELPLRHALVVEDDLVIALTAEALLHRIGCVDIVLAGSQTEAMAALRSRAFDLALVDVNLGDHDSRAVVQQLRALGVPTVLATGYSDEAHLPATLHGLPRLCKPYGEAELRRLLTDLAGEPTPPAAPRATDADSGRAAAEEVAQHRVTML